MSLVLFGEGMEDESRAAYSTGGHARGAYIPYSSVTPVTDHMHLREDQHSDAAVSVMRLSA